MLQRFFSPKSKNGKLIRKRKRHEVNAFSLFHARILHGRRLKLSRWLIMSVMTHKILFSNRTAPKARHREPREKVRTGHFLIDCIRWKNSLLRSLNVQSFSGDPRLMIREETCANLTRVSTSSFLCKSNFHSRARAHYQTDLFALAARR